MAANTAAAAGPLVTVSLVTYNGMRWLPGCLESVRAQDLPDWELLVLDNASSDGSTGWLRDIVAQDRRMRLTALTSNLGFAAGHNKNIFAARGEFVLLLNQDVELDRGFLRAAVDALQGRPKVGAVQPRLRRLAAPGERTNILDSTGLLMYRDRRVVSRRQGEREHNVDLVPGPVWGADGPAPVYRQAALLSARVPKTRGRWEVLDEDFFMYKEDVDLAWRLRILGWQTWYEPTAVAWHARAAGARRARSLLDVAHASRLIPRWIKILSWRNQRLMQIKNERLEDLMPDIAWVARRELLSLAFIVLADPSRLVALRGFLWYAARAWRRRSALRL
ncbi:MAG: glycosyltransferase family 2 protein [Chloroflexota bacterium]|nr:glycosyltransferase family 2 protein [Chloroflexota bacterium]